MKKWIIANTLMLFIMFSLGIYGKAQTWDSGLNKVTTVVEIQKMLSDVPIRTMDSNLDGSEEVANDLTADEQIEHYVNQISDNSKLVHTFLTGREMTVLIVKPKGDWQFMEGASLQTCVVEKVLQGEETLLNKEVDIAEVFEIYYKDKELNGQMTKNFMLPDNSYLIFSERSEDEGYFENPTFSTLTCVLSRLNITSDYSKVVKDNSTLHTYSEYSESEFFVNSQETLDLLLASKHKVFSKYGIE